MHAEEVKVEQGMGLYNIFQSMMENAMMAVNHRTKEGKDEEGDIQISIPTDSNNRKPAPTLEVPGIKENESENFVITWPNLGMIAPDYTYILILIVYYTWVKFFNIN